MQLVPKLALVLCTLAALPLVRAERVETAPAVPAAMLPAAALRTVILVRHAEKATDDPKDPSLSEAGAKRAEALARLLAHSGAKRLVASEFKRTQQTLAPLAQALGLDVETVSAKELDALARGIEESTAPVTVVAGHSNTVPALAARLGVQLERLKESPQGALLGDDEYGRVFVVTLAPKGAEVAASVVELAY